MESIALSDIFSDQTKHDQEYNHFEDIEILWKENNLEVECVELIQKKASDYHAKHIFLSKISGTYDKLPFRVC